jgi:hypothetical protein
MPSLNPRAKEFHHREGRQSTTNWSPIIETVPQPGNTEPSPYINGPRRTLFARYRQREMHYCATPGYSPSIIESKRYLVDLQAEQTYLLNSLRDENIRVMDLFRQVPPLEETIGLTQEPRLRRSAKKQLGWLKHRINGIAHFPFLGLVKLFFFL